MLWYGTRSFSIEMRLVVTLSFILSCGSTSCVYSSHHCIDQNHDGLCDDKNHHGTSDSATPGAATSEPPPIDVIGGVIGVVFGVRLDEATGELDVQRIEGLRADSRPR